MTAQDYVWFIDPMGDPTTNEVIFRQLQIPEENLQENVRCLDGRKRTLWQCRSYDDVGNLIRFSKGQAISFMIFNRRGPNGQIRRCTFMYKRKAKK